MKKVFAKKREGIPFTKKGYQKLLDQKAELFGQRPEAVKNLREAREMGDLSENEYYTTSREKLSFLDGRISRVEQLIKSAVIVEAAGTGKVEIGSKVLITDGKKEREYTLVGGHESDPFKNTISHKSPIGKALMGKKEQDVVMFNIPKGTAKYTILKIN